MGSDAKAFSAVEISLGFWFLYAQVQRGTSGIATLKNVLI